MALTQQFTAGEDLTAAKLNASSIPVVSATTDIATPFTGQIIFNTSTGCLHRYTGSAWTLFDANTQSAYKSAIESVTNSTTFQNDDHFSFSVLASSTYALDGYVVYDGASGTGDIKTQWTGPAGASMYYTNFGTNVSGGLTTYNVVTQGLGASRDMGANGATAMSFAPKAVLVVAGTAGTFQFQWAQNTSSATSTRILSGWMKLTKIA